MTANGVNTATGEIVALTTTAQPFALTDYLASLNASDSLAQQNALASAYDAACASLIGPNDVQLAEGRSFKKKSAWRKLARYFTISVEIVRVEREILGNADFLATVTARAVAPWGQSYEEVGACCTDEATGRRVISVADAIATASTRASNRAVSNLIAMGEVSAEEIDKGDAAPRAARPASASKPAGGATMPFGKTKGTLLANLPTGEVQSALDWAESKGKFVEFQADARAELSKREKPVRVMASESGGTGLPTDEEAFAATAEDDGLPF